MHSLSNRRNFFLILTTVSIMAACSVVYLGLKQSVWFDEAYSIDIAKQSWGEIVRLTAEDVHPPLYYWLLKFWMLLFGDNELALRSMSALFFGASLVTMGALLRKFFGAKTALFALAFILAAPFLLRYGFEIRMYSLASCIGVLATYVLVTAVDTKQERRRRLLMGLYALLVVAGMYTLYFMALIWITHLVWLCIKSREKGKYLLIEGVVAYGVSLLLFLPWLPSVLAGLAGGTLSPVTHALNFDNLVGIVTYMFLYQPPWRFSPGYVAIIVVTLLLIGLIVWSGYTYATARQRRAMFLFALYFLVPIAVLFVVTQFKPIYLERYIAHFAIGGYALIGVCAAITLQKADWLRRDAAVLLLLVFLSGCVSLAQYGNYNFQRLHTPSIKQVSALLDSCKSGAVVFADGPQIAVELGYYVRECPIYFFNETLEMTGGFAMISNSPYRVASSKELPDSDEVLHVYYNTPKNVLPDIYERTAIVTADKVTVETYRRGGV